MILLVAVISIVPLQIRAQGTPRGECPTMSSHHRGVNHRGDHMMGFSHEKTTHHFRLFMDGGEIEVLANDSKDVASRDQIRSHLAHIAEMFSAGDFNAPLLIHDRVPPGAPEMRQLKEAITYKFSARERGGSVRITTHHAAALKAIHEFLSFQIEDHQTGDSLRVSDRKE
jgi:hypothetical protein